MFEENTCIDQLKFREMVIVRWASESSDAANVAPSSPSVLNFLKSVGYNIGETVSLRCAPCPDEPDQYLVLPMQSEEEAMRISYDSFFRGFALDGVRIHVHRLLGPNGARLRDVADCLQLWHEQFNNDELMNIILELIKMETREKQDFKRDAHRMIDEGLRELVEDAHCAVFGSASSSVRMNAYSDYDINVESISTSSSAKKIRNLRQILDNPLILTKQPLTKAELVSYPQEDIVKVLFKCFNDNQLFKDRFEMRFVPARTPIMIFKTREKDGMIALFDVSVNNQIGADKACLLDQFIIKDKSTSGKTKLAMTYLVHWAKSNALMNGVYTEEKMETKLGFNSYIFNQMFIHFVQVFYNKQLVFPGNQFPERVIDYNFDDIFQDYTHFLREFFKYYASFDFNTFAIYGTKQLKKKTVAGAHEVPESALMIMDPMDVTHNISARVTEEGMRLLRGLIRNALLILKQKNFRVSLLLRTNHNAMMLMKNKETHTWGITKQLPDALSEFASVCRGHEDYLTFELPEIIQTPAELFVLLTRMLRFVANPSHERPGIDNLYNSIGIIFAVYTKSWMSRRMKKRALKNLYEIKSNLHLEVMCSDAYHNEEEPVAEVRMVMTDSSDTSQKIVYVEILKGGVHDIREAMRFLLDQFVLNNLTELMQDGIMNIANIPVQSFDS